MKEEEIELFCLVGFDDYRAIYDRPEREEADRIYAESKDLEKVKEFCKNVRRKDYAKALKAKANLTKRFAKRTFNTFKAVNPVQKMARKQAFDFAENINEMIKEGTNLIIAGCGCVGTGKTHLAYAIANYILDKGIPTEVYNTVDLIDTLKEFDTNKKNQISKIDVLIIDDISKAYGTAWLAAELYGILNRRYENELLTIITVEEDIDEINKLFTMSINGEIKNKGKSLISRLTENFIYIRLTGDDYRHQRGVNNV